MGILQRFSDIMRSNFNALLDRCEDPEKMIEQSLLDLRRDLAEVKKETANVMADEKSAKRRIETCKAQVEKYALAARNAVKAGQDDDARELIAEKQQYEANLPALEQAYALAQANAEKMVQMHDKLVADIAALETRKDAVKGKVAVAKAQQRMNKVVAGVGDGSASIAAFERMEEKADKMLDAAMAEAELNVDKNEGLVEKYARCGLNVEEELERIKGEVR